LIKDEQLGRGSEEELDNTKNELDGHLEVLS